MGAAYFYMLTESSVAQTLQTLLPRALDRGWQVELRGVDAAAMERLDQDLWQGPADDFLPHGMAGGPQDGLQPVLLTTSPTPGRDCIMAVDGAVVDADQVRASQRVCILFDGLDDAALAQARVQWKSLTGAGCAAQYWAQDNGRWVMKAEAAGSTAP